MFEQIANDSPKAFQLFFDYTYSDLYRYVSYFIDDEEMSKDVISDVYLYIWQNRRKLPEVQSHENFLFICVRNQALNCLKQINRYQKIRLENVEALQISEKKNPEQEVLDNELKDILELAVNSLPNRCRLIFFMIREEGLKYKEVADRLQISVRTVHAQMCIALKRIGRVINEYSFNK